MVPSECLVEVEALYFASSGGEVSGHARTRAVCFVTRVCGVDVGWSTRGPGLPDSVKLRLGVHVTPERILTR